MKSEDEKLLKSIRRELKLTQSELTKAALRQKLEALKHKMKEEKKILELVS